MVKDSIVLKVVMMGGGKCLSPEIKKRKNIQNGLEKVCQEVGGSFLEVEG